MQTLTVMLCSLIDMTSDGQCQRVDRTNIIYTTRLEEYRYSREILYYTRFAESLERIKYARMRFVRSKYGDRHCARSMQMK